MSAAYSQDLRDRVIAARDGGMKSRRAAGLCRVSASWVRRVMHMQRRRGHGETRPRGRSRVGGRLVQTVPHGHWKTTTTTLIAAPGIGGGVRRPTAVDGAVHRGVFEAFVEQVPSPQLRPGDVVVMGWATCPVTSGSGRGGGPGRPARWRRPCRRARRT